MCKIYSFSVLFQVYGRRAEALRPLGNMQRCKGHKLSLNLAFFFQTIGLSNVVPKNHMMY